jgi:preprotein translocase SecE subunit
MASIVKEDQEAKSEDRDRREDEGGDEIVEYRRPGAAEPARPAPSDDGFFHIYKSGQGYWTRMGTALAAGLIAMLVIYFLYQHLPTWLTPALDHSKTITDPAAKLAAANHAVVTARNATIGICAAFLAGYALLVYWLMNKPANADFLIATDSEMKKVNWTSRKELMGSTKVVIIFMFLIAFLLFAFDIFFGYLFYFMGVLKTKPF